MSKTSIWRNQQSPPFATGIVILIIIHLKLSYEPIFILTLCKITLAVGVGVYLFASFRPNLIRAKILKTFHQTYACEVMFEGIQTGF